MTARDHAAEAEGYLRAGDVARAQVHATLAQATATAAQADALAWACNLWAAATERRRWLLTMRTLFWSLASSHGEVTAEIKRK